MKTNNVVSIATAAIATAALTVVIFGGGSMEAGSESAAAGFRIVQPKLAIHGVEFTVAAADGRSFQAGDQPVFELKAVNTNDEPASVDVQVALTATSPGGFRSRVMSAPQPLWTTTESLKLGARETKMVSLTAQTNLPSNRMFSVWLSEAPAQENALVARLSFFGGGIVALNFSTFTNAPVALQAGLTAAK